MDFFSEVKRLFEGELSEAVSKSDKEVIKAFLYEKPAANSRLETDGEVLNGLWSGGRRIAWWEDNRPVYREPSTRTEEEIVRMLKKIGGPIVKMVNESWAVFEADDADKYQHVGGGRYKKKKDVGKEGTPTYKKEGDKFVEVDKGEEPEEKETKAETETKAKPKEKGAKTKGEPAEAGASTEGARAEHVEAFRNNLKRVSSAIENTIAPIKDKLPTDELLTSIEQQTDELDPADEKQQRNLNVLHRKYKAIDVANRRFAMEQSSAYPTVDLPTVVTNPIKAIGSAVSYMFRPSKKKSVAAFTSPTLNRDLYLDDLWSREGENDWFRSVIDPTDIVKPGTELYKIVPDEYKREVINSLGKYLTAYASEDIFSSLIEAIDASSPEALGINDDEFSELESTYQQYKADVKQAREGLRDILQKIQKNIKYNESDDSLSWNDENAEQDEVKQQLSQIRQQLEKLTSGAAVPQTVKESFSFIESEKRYDPQNGVVYYKDGGKVYASPVTNPRQRVEITNENIIKKLSFS